MGDKNRFYDTLIKAGNLVLNSKPFAKWLEFFAPVDSAVDKEGFCDNQYRIQRELLDTWAKNMQADMESLEAKLSWDNHIHSYMFAGNAFKSRGGEILGDFPVPINMYDMPYRSLCKTARAIIDISSDGYTGNMSFRQQYGEPFLDSITVAEPITGIGILDKIKDLPITIISTAEPIEEQMRRLDYDYRGSRNDDAPFYYEPKGLTFSDLISFGHIVADLKKRITTMYLKESRNDSLSDSDRYDTPYFPSSFLNYLGSKNESEAKKFRAQFRQTVKEIVKASIQQRNEKIVDLILGSADNTTGDVFYIAGGDKKDINGRPENHPYSPDVLVKFPNNTSFFLRRYILKFEHPDKQGERKFSTTYMKESKGDYCVWMKDKRGLEKVVEYLSRF